MGISVDYLSVVRAKELDLSLRGGQLLTAGAGVLQGLHLGRVAEIEERQRVKTETKWKWEIQMAATNRGKFNLAQEQIYLGQSGQCSIIIKSPLS